jgi:O-antigen ligase
MRYFDWALAAVLVYLPYQQHYPLILPMKGVNIINVIFLVLLAAILMRKGPPAPPTPLKGRFLLMMAALALSFVIGQYYDSSRFDDDLTLLKSNIFYMLFYFLFYHAARDVRTIRFSLGAILFATFLVSLQGLRQALDFGIGSFAPHHRVSGPFAQGTIGGANMAAAYYVIFVPIFFTVFLVCKSRPVARVVALGCVALGTFSTFFTFSRQAYFIIAAMFTFQALRRSLLVGLLVIAAAATFEFWAPEGVIQRIEMTTRDDSGGETKLDESTESRFIIWEGAMKLIAEKPWGVGLARFRREIGKYAPAYHNYDAHNGYVLVTTECGLLGGFAMLWLIAGLYFLARRVEKLDDTEDTRLIGGAFTIAAIGVFCTNLFGSRIFNGEVMANFWALAGLGARYYTLVLERQGAAQAASAERIGENLKSETSRENRASVLPRLL